MGENIILDKNNTQMKFYLQIPLASSIFVVNLKDQNLREEVMLKGTN